MVLASASIIGVVQPGKAQQFIDTANRRRTVVSDGAVVGILTGFSVTPNAPMSGAEVRNTKASAPLAG